MFNNREVLGAGNEGWAYSTELGIFFPGPLVVRETSGLGRSSTLPRRMQIQSEASPGRKQSTEPFGSLATFLLLAGPFALCRGHLLSREV